MPDQFDDYSKPLVPDEASTMPDPLTEEGIEQIQEEARKSFSLSDRLQDINHRSTSILIFTDMEAVDEYNKINAKAQSLSDDLGKINLAGLSAVVEAATTDETRAAAQSALESALSRKADLQARFDEMESSVAKAREKMLAGSFVIQMKAYPNIAVKVTKRDIRKKFSDPALGRVPDDRVEEADAALHMALLGQAIVKVTSPDGDLEFDRSTIGQELSDSLPPAQWDRLFQTFMRLTLSDEIAKAAVDDPGF
jgi:hypothetical protein